VSWLFACGSRPGLCYPVIPDSTEEDQRGVEKVEFCTSPASNGSHVALCRYLGVCRVFWSVHCSLYRPTFELAAHYGGEVEPAASYYDDSVYTSPPAPPRQPAPPPADDWMYGCPQSRTFKILQSVMHNEGQSALTASLFPLVCSAVV